MEEGVVQFDHPFWSEGSAGAKCGVPGRPTSLTVVNSCAGALWSKVVPHKGQCKFAKVGAAKWLKSLGYTCMILQSDSEHSLMKGGRCHQGLGDLGDARCADHKKVATLFDAVERGSRGVERCHRQSRAGIVAPGEYADRQGDHTRDILVCLGG